MSQSHWEFLSHLFDYGSFAVLLVLCVVAAVAVARTPSEPSESETEARVQLGRS
jgi:hypothetical protein